jgi:phage shock protein PspC (stress-responsive transcriptional regulator)
MTLGAPGRRLLLAVHLACSVGWIGAVCAYLVLAVAVPATRDPATVEAAWIGMELVGWYAIVPLAVSSLATGILLAWLTRWGLVRHYWVLISLLGTTVLTTVLILHMPDVSAQAATARDADREHLAQMGSDIPHAAIGLVLLIGILVLNIYKPRGMTRYGWRKDREERARAAADRDPTTSRE